ncbi:hypothetical protein SIO70_00210 [Chitinophaga sancti]|uniref:hypothetical protein n=1 Tax=Chitinophaga sancti TaxID=1004 RepID=UPI002A74CB95|nr:hypothetical protein [Chitinophaga sancti]WPQ63285.1 hypothetical protein SIO70_00210 [Chitinophaga sancti]
MRISERFNLNKVQPQLDFVDVDTNTDTPLFLDPFFLSLRTDNWSIEASKTIRSFFQQVLDLIGKNQIQDAKKLFIHLQEPNSTCLGLSKNQPQGRGVGKTDTDDIFNSIVNSRAIQSGLIKDLEDSVLFVEGFGKDKLSDMTTNIIKQSLIEYTKCQCILHEIPLTPDIPTGFYWNRGETCWEQVRTDALIIEGRPILLVPKGVVSFCADYTPQEYYSHFVLNFMRNEQLLLNTALVQKRKDNTLYVTKKSVKEKFPISKDFLADFSRKHPDVLKDFKKQTSTDSLTNEDLNPGINLADLINALSKSLQNLPAGNNDASNYHRLMKGILELLFYPHLINPSLETEIHDGRKRIDITFDNAATDGIFFRLSNNMNLPSQFIMIECKNYSSDPANPELDQLAGRFSPNRGKVGFLVCRSIEEMERFIARCQDTYRDERGLIVPIVDVDIIRLLSSFVNPDSDYMEKFLSDRIRTIATN